MWLAVVDPEWFHSSTETPSPQVETTLHLQISHSLHFIDFQQLLDQKVGGAPLEKWARMRIVDPPLVRVQ